MTSDRRRAVLAIFELDNVGKLVWRTLPVYSYYHKGDIDRNLATVGYDRVIVINYQHGNTKNNIYNLLRRYKNLTVHLNSKFKVLTISDKTSPISLEMVRKILAEELWRHSLI